ncbi:MAG: shikimate dehydrogenase [Methylococcales symbiont of Hymedesmia sp. n. MRB-2018]|nr:MAG: shikimate dehydrogenase [Methylococcales symbiont of Hymedesmia sp. n. MRB-2018]KAF3983284.1 MAG: shikimate dehydrogenase [Methylococcales symbiont of Hymedesmia sp. n. MRB-2018]
MPDKDRYAVFGQPINHSKSPRIHQLFAEQTDQLLSYEAQDVPADAFESAIHVFLRQGGKGLNCTVPLKELAWQRADQLSQRATRSKAVNTLILQENGALLGDNTDGIGLVTDLTKNHQINLSNSRILILGAGGASRGIIEPLMQQAPKHIIIANRTVEKAMTLSDEFSVLGKIKGCAYDDIKNSQFDLILNATSASLSGKLPPLADNILAEKGCCYDLAYGNKPTPFMLWGQTQNAEKSLDGLGMLVEQAAEAFYLWRNVRPETSAIIDLLNSERT